MEAAPKPAAALALRCGSPLHTHFFTNLPYRSPVTAHDYREQTVTQSSDQVLALATIFAETIDQTTISDHVDDSSLTPRLSVTDSVAALFVRI